MKYLTYLVLLLASTSASAGQVTVPNTFVSGQAAVAAEVNENFTAVATAINANASDINNVANEVAINTIAIANASKSLHVVDGAGNSIGLLVNLDQEAVTVFTDKGYIRGYVSRASGGVATYGLRAASYLTTDCSGPEYTDNPNGTVYESFKSGRRYVPRNGQMVTVTVGSHYVNGVCSLGSWSPSLTLDVWASLPNDPLITGVPNTNYTTPLNLELK